MIFLVILTLFLASVVLLAMKKKPIVSAINSSFISVLSIVVFILNTYLKMFNAGAIVLSVFSLILSLIAIGISIYELKYFKTAEEEEEKVEENEKKSLKIHKIISLVSSCLSLIVLILTLFLPILNVNNGTTNTTISLISSVNNNDSPIFLTIPFFVVLISVCVLSLVFVETLSNYKNDKKYILKSYNFVLGIAAYSLVYFVFGYFLSFFLNKNTSNSGTIQKYSTLAYIPFIIAFIILLVASISKGKINSLILDLKKEKKKKLYKIEPLLYLFALSIVLLLSLFIDVIKVTTKIDLNISNTEQTVQYTGLDLLTKSSELEGGYQILSFVLLAFLICSFVMLVLSISSYICKNKEYYRIIKFSSISNLVFITLLGLMGIYFTIAKKINEDGVKSLFAAYGINFDGKIEYDIKTNTIYLAAVSLVIVIVMVIRKQFNLNVANEEVDINLIGDKTGENSSKNSKNTTPLLEHFDSCPAFSVLDSKEGDYKKDFEERLNSLFINPNLGSVCSFVVNYAKNSRLHLSYTKEDIATFVAGLGASKLTILQGMSGTGKTSLPKIFSEAIFGNCEIVEVESSWRDKNELLGYYNEFSKIYTPKKFTQFLYKASLNPHILTFVVLDELNLSRIEYYFSDFLSLMENEEGNRKIKLVNIELHKNVNGELTDFKNLEDGTTLNVPSNVWFIGTANRDESTFAISDKVYDRAQTMNFNKRAPKVRDYGEPLNKKFLSYDTFNELLVNAKRLGHYEVEDDQIVKAVEELLRPFNISFGNRILNQMEDFVNIYTSCFVDKEARKKEAVEKIILSKVVSKLETKIVDNKDELAKEFDKLGLKECSDFIRKLSED